MQVRTVPPLEGCSSDDQVAAAAGARVNSPGRKSIFSAADTSKRASPYRPAQIWLLYGSGNGHRVAGRRRDFASLG